MTKRLAFVFATVFCFLAVVCSYAPVSAKDTWTSVRSKNFLLVGNASEKEIRQVGVRLEQFREVFFAFIYDDERQLTRADHRYRFQKRRLLPALQTQ